ncbi:MAG TPA: sigma-70 family RNA polymerase sigma factor [Paludibacter sp.]|nr:sigma-70 family RNA polymerase sigma factor [Paludibacter sp.]
MKNNNKISELTNEELLQFYVESGDIAFFGELYRRYIPKIYGLCLKYLGEKEIARDAVMDIFSGLTEKVKQYEINNFNTWLYSVAKNHCLQIIRKDKQTIFIKIEDAFVENEDNFTLNDKPQSQEEMAALEYCMGTLPEEQQKSIKLFFFEEQSYADIVDITGYTLSKVKSYIQNGKRNLKSCIIKVLKTI